MAHGDSSLELKGLTKTFGALPVLRRISLSFAVGERVLLLGANGAGKSTLLRVVAGLTRPDQGSIIQRLPGRVSLFSHQLFLYPRLSVRENLALFASLQGGGIDVDGVVTEWGLEEYSNRMVGSLSKGNQARVSLARACLAPTPVLLLDEPTSNLDERGTRQLLSMVERVRSSNEQPPIVIVATHDLHRLQNFATRVIVMSVGEVVADTGSAASQESISTIVQLYRESNR